MKNYCLLAVITLFLFTSCSTTQPLFDNEVADTNNRMILHQYFSQKEPILKAGDKITLSIWGHDDLSIGSVNSKFSSNEATGRWITIDLQGEVNLAKVGRVKIAGFNLKEVNYILEQAYSKHLKDPIVNVKVLNHYVTVLGEVNAPGNYELGNENLTLIQILGQAEGLGDYANPQCIKVVRQIEGKPIKLIVDMTDIISTSDYNITLQSNDIVYVEPSLHKAKDNNLNKAIPVASLITGISVLLSIFLKN